MADKARSQGADTPLASAISEEVNVVPETKEAPEATDLKAEVITSGYKLASPTKRQQRFIKVGGEAPCRVVKVVKDPERHDEFETYDEEGNLQVYQFPYPRADKTWDRQRLNAELDEAGLVRAEEFGDKSLPKWCELNDCWEVATDGNFCRKLHRDMALTAHDRILLI